ncbi:MAG: hypothetical protein AMK73_05370 [Planctomycetes bacterium SM23_32]|nr:MAG: hypothetical protein AMK73_05370 [Planctomycetes bacterium SM23_32]
MGYAAAHIVLGSRRQARELLEVLEADLGLWERAVLQYSLDRPSVHYKGRIGPVPAGSELGRALADMEPGELKLWQQGDAWHVLRFIRAVPAADEAFEEVTDRLRAELTVVECSRRYQALLAELHRDADVVVNLPGDPAARPLLGEDVAAYVNGEPLMMGELADVLIEEFGDLMLEAYVERLLIEQEAERRGLAVSEEEVGERMAAIADQLVAEQAGRQGMTMAELEGSPTGADAEAADLRAGLLRQFVSRRDVEATLLAERMVAPGVEVTEADIAEAYGDLGRDRFVVEELATDSVPAAERMHRRVQEGLSFELVARTELAEPGAWVQGGLRGVVSSAHPYYVYVKDLREGEVSGVFKEGGQYRIIRVLRRDPPSDPPPLESVRETLAQEVRLRKSRARIRALLVRLKAEADVEVRPN